MPTLPPNVHVSQHPCLRAKLSQLRDSNTNPRETKTLVHEISLILGCEALAVGMATKQGPTRQTHLGYEYTTVETSPETISLVPILRSGLGMIDAIQTLLPAQVPIHHLGLYREPTTLEPVEYYNNLPYHQPPTVLPSTPSPTAASALAIIVDPVIATGATAVAAIQTLREWGVQRIVLLAVLGAVPGVVRAAEEWSEGVQIWLGGLDEEVTEKGMIKPGVGDVGDRLFLTIGK